jgi:hypothetical protein
LGFRPFVRVGLFITFCAALGLAIYGERGGIRGLQVISALFGVGMGFANTALLIAVQTSVSWGERGIATASTMFFRTIGGALAVSVMGGVLNAALARSPSVSEELASRVLSPEGVRGLQPALIDEVSGAIALGVGWIFWIVVGIAAVAFVTCLWFPEIKKPNADEVPEALAGH